MIPNQWYAILESNEIKKGRPVGVTRLGEKLVLWRDPVGRLTCQRDLCPHRGVALSAGQLLDGCIECPFHGFRFDTSGRCTLIPANGRNAAVPKVMQVYTYPTRELHGLVYVWYGEPQAEYPDPPFFDTIDPTLPYASIRDHWPIHYSRAIENQLDVVHLPFVHKTTIGAGNHTLVHGPKSRLTHQPGSSDLLEIWIRNEVDSGQNPLSPSEFDPPGRPLLQFRYPNVWHNWLGDGMHVFLAFAPIDNENTMMYIRLYQGMVRAPLLRDIFALFANIGNWVIERQDRRVVITQRPGRTSLNMDEKLIQGDGPIIAYRRRRDELIDAGTA